MQLSRNIRQLPAIKVERLMMTRLHRLLQFLIRQLEGCLDESVSYMSTTCGICKSIANYSNTLRVVTLLHYMKLVWIRPKHFKRVDFCHSRVRCKDEPPKCQYPRWSRARLKSRLGQNFCLISTW